MLQDQSHLTYGMPKNGDMGHDPNERSNETANLNL